MPVDMPMNLEQLMLIHERPAIYQQVDESASNQSSIQSAKEAAIKKAALSAGLKGGLSYKLKHIQKTINQLSRELDTIYNFNGLMIQNLVVPPVITEARDLYNQDGEYAIRLSGALYQIQTQAKFASVPPNWRGYLTFPEVSVTKYDLQTTLKPSTDQEKEIWKDGVKDGWKQGEEQADLMVVQAMDKLNRDFIGMTRFHRFVTEGKISLPAIASENISVIKKGNTMSVDETLLRITTLPEFNSELIDWDGALISTNDDKSQ